MHGERRSKSGLGRVVFTLQRTEVEIIREPRGRVEVCVKGETRGESSYIQEVEKKLIYKRGEMLMEFSAGLGGRCHCRIPQCCLYIM